MLLSVEDLRVAYGPIEALHGISFQVAKERRNPHRGQRVGKSTTLMSLMRLPPPGSPHFSIRADDF